MGDVPIISEGRYIEDKCYVPAAWALGRLQPEQLPFPGVSEEEVDGLGDVTKAEILEAVGFY